MPEEARDWCEPDLRISCGKPYREILRVAAEEQADLIVLGVHGLGPDRPHAVRIDRRSTSCGGDLPGADGQGLRCSRPRPSPAYYRHPAVRARIAEYCSGSVGLAGYGGRGGLRASDMAPVPVGVGELTTSRRRRRRLPLAGGSRRNAHPARRRLRQPAAIPAEANGTRHLLPPAGAGLSTRSRAALPGAGVAPSTLMTGRGYHFTARAVRGLAAARRADRRRPALAPRCAPATSGDGRRAAGRVDGRGARRRGPAASRRSRTSVMRTASTADVPVTLADVPPPGRGPFVCLDLSAYGDPRLQPPRPLRLLLPPEGLRDRRRPGPAVRDRPAPRRPVARSPCWRSGRIPRRRRGWPRRRATDSGRRRTPRGGSRSYRRQLLARFHRGFDEGPRSVRAPPPTSTRASLPRTCPLCVRRALEWPNPALLVPMALRTVALVLWSRGWHPRRVADLVRVALRGRPRLGRPVDALRARRRARTSTSACSAGAWSRGATRPRLHLRTPSSSAAAARRRMRARAPAAVSRLRHPMVALGADA